MASAEATTPATGRLQNGSLAGGQFINELPTTVCVQPRLVMERVVADLVTGLSDRRKCGAVDRQRGVLADHKHGNLDPSACEEIQESGYDQVQIRRELAPGFIAVRFEIRPAVVEVERDAGNWPIHGILFAGVHFTLNRASGFANKKDCPVPSKTALLKALCDFVV